MPWIGLNYCCWQGPPRPLLLDEPIQSLRLLLLFHLLSAHSLSSSIKKWVGMHEKLKCVITYSPFWTISFPEGYLLLNSTWWQGCIVFINLHPTQTSLLRELIKIKISDFCLKKKGLFTHHHTKDYENWGKGGDQREGHEFYAGKGGKNFFFNWKL